MKTYKQMKAAREYVNQLALLSGLSQQQLTMFAGMSVALQWVCDEGGTTLQRLISGETVNVGNTIIPAHLLEALAEKRKEHGL